MQQLPPARPNPCATESAIQVVPASFTILVSLAVAALIWSPVPAATSQADDNGAQLHAAMPLGGDSLILQPSKQRLNMLVTVESKDFENIKLSGDNRTRKVTDLDGNPVTSYPRELTFRFTIGSRTTKEEAVPYTVETQLSPDKFQSSLRFRLKVFRGVEARHFEPAEARIIGVPAEIPYDERIYLVTFSLPEIPVGDRIMLEVLDESGARIAKFHLQLM
jgi:hypothetical protein